MKSKWVRAVLIPLVMCGTVALATNEPPTPDRPAELKEGVKLHELKFVDPVPYDTIAWALAILVGVPAILIAYCRAWIARRKGKPIDTHRRVILLPSVIMASTGVVMVLLKTASSLWFMSTSGFTGPSARAMLFLNVAWSFRLFAISLIGATIGLAGVLLLPVERKGNQSPQQPPA